MLVYLHDKLILKLAHQSLGFFSINRHLILFRLIAALTREHGGREQAEGLVTAGAHSRVAGNTSHVVPRPLDTMLSRFFVAATDQNVFVLPPVGRFRLPF